MDQLGKIVRARREKRGETYKQMAKAIGCSEAFARHIECSQLVPISERLIIAVRRHYRIPAAIISTPAAIRRKRGKAYYKARSA